MYTKAFQLIDAAHISGANCAKFQMRDLNELYINSGRSSDLKNDLGAQYTLDLLERFQLSDDDLYKCLDYTLSKGMLPLCTPWDESSVEKLSHWGLEGFKVSSADFTNHDLLSKVALKQKPLICSTGMSTEEEILSGITKLDDLSVDYVLLHCNSTYPTPFKDVNLKYLSHLADLSSGPVGYSGHERGIEIPIAAVALGAAVIEKHITLDRNMEGNDHKVSLLTSEFKSMVTGIRRVEESLGNSNARQISQGEMMNRETLAKSLIAKCEIPAGTRLTREMIDIKSPGQGLQPDKIPDILGKKLFIAKSAGDFFFESDISPTNIGPRKYKFLQPFGLQ